MMNSGAPARKAPCSPKTAPVHLEAEVKGITCSAVQEVPEENLAAMARPVTRSGGYSSPSSRIGSPASMTASVMVPVLSTHSTSTRARFSIQVMSWVKTRFRARRRTLTASATLVSRYSPSGIIPMRAATVAFTEACRPISSTRNCLINSAIPRGTMTMPMTRITLSRDAIISEAPGFASFFASSVSFAA